MVPKPFHTISMVHPHVVIKNIYSYLHLKNRHEEDAENEIRIVIGLKWWGHLQKIRITILELYDKWVCMYLKIKYNLLISMMPSTPKSMDDIIMGISSGLLFILLGEISGKSIYWWYGLCFKISNTRSCIIYCWGAVIDVCRFWLAKNPHPHNHLSNKGGVHLVPNYT